MATQPSGRPNDGITGARSGGQVHALVGQSYFLGKYLTLLMLLKSES